ncbi:MAG: MFS transporter [Bacteroidales bacterium]|nr:MFS transporter [Bacteroidales bacterium]MCF8403051.1 MFS transporter [Bacteroidales bacterium]
MPGTDITFTRDLQYYKFCLYGFFKNLRLFEPFFILFFLESGLSFLQIGILYSIREISRYILEIPAGFIADTIGRKKSMVSSFLFYIASFIIFYLSRSYTLLIVAMLFYSFGDAFRTGTHKAMIFDYLKIHRWEHLKVSYYGHTRSYSQIGSAVSALLAGLFVFFTEEYRTIFLFVIIPYFFDLLLIVSYPNALNGKQASLNKTIILESFKETWNDFKLSFGKAVLWKSIANLSVFTGYYKSVKDYLQPLIQTLALSLPFLTLYDGKQRTAVLVGGIYFIIYFLTSISARNSSRVVQLFRNLTSSMNISLLAGLGMGILAGICFRFDWFILAVIAMVFIFIIENFRKPIGISYIAEVGKSEILATTLSIESQAHTLVAAMLAPVIGFIADYTGVGNAILITSAVLMMLFPLLMLKSKK